MNKAIFLSQLAGLVAVRSVSNDRSSNKKLITLVKKLANPKALRRQWSNKNADIILLGSKNTLRPDVAFLVHGDVVSGTPDLFKLKQKGDRLNGRGVSDMKFSIPIGLALLDNWIDENKESSFSFVITTDEELGGFNGSKLLANKYKFHPKLLIVPDGGDNFEFVTKSKGVVQILVQSKGKPAHASEPWFGINAIEPLIKLISVLMAEYSKNNLKPNWDVTCNIGQIHGGESTNQVCAYAEMKLDFRFPDTFSQNKIFNHIKEISRKEKLNLKFSIIAGGEATFTDPKAKIVVSFVKIFEKYLSKKIKIVGDTGASDARFFKGVPALMIKPFGGDIHGNHEWISLNACMIYFRAVNEFLMDNFK